MVDRLIRITVLALLRLRYRVRVTGAGAVAQRGRTGILFLPNHPALVDPLMVVAHLHRLFRPHPLANAEQISHPLVRWVADRVGVRPIADMSAQGPQARDQVAAVVTACAEGLKSGENILLYPSGHLYRTRWEDLRGNSAVELILKQVPEARVVLVRTRGLWGSSFSYAAGRMPNVARGLQSHVWTLLKNFVFFTPRRDVALELHEPADLPRAAGRAALNAFIERYYNQDAPPNTYVPYTIWERGGPRALPDPPAASVAGSPDEVPEATRRIVLDQLRQLTGISELSNAQRLAQDLGMDSLARADLLLWLGQEFGFHTADVTSLATVGDVVLAARGQNVAARTFEVAPIPAAWWERRAERPIHIPDDTYLTSAFLTQAARDPRRAIIADQRSGVLTCRDVITAILALKPLIQSLPGERIGIMLPASVGATLAYLAALFAGKTPVLINWTTGARNLAHSLELTGAQHILSAAAMVQRIESRGTDLSAIRERFVFLEELRKQITFPAKIAAALRARFSWAALRNARPREIAAILVTSGSEALPKAVPLSHVNLLSNLRGVPHFAQLSEGDSLLGMLPPFHSFGLTVTMLLPLVSGVRVVYHADPTEGWVIAALIATYKPTVIVGTPTFLAGIARAAQAGECEHSVRTLGDGEREHSVRTTGQLDSLRIAVTGAEQCPQRTYDLLAQRAPNAIVIEGYGVTECSPIISANSEQDPRKFTIGRLLPSYESAIIHPETGETTRDGEAGLLLVRGPSVFAGYLGSDAASPFVQHAGKSWYRTGDLVRRDPDGVMHFAGRLKRFVKLGGEMISLPAIEAVLLAHFEQNRDPGAAGTFSREEAVFPEQSRDHEGAVFSPPRPNSGAPEGPLLAVEATPSEDHPEIVLFSTFELDRAAANRVIREAQLSPLHNVTRVERIDSIPVLGTGKTDYRSLRAQLQSR